MFSLLTLFIVEEAVLKATDWWPEARKQINIF